MHFSRQTPFQLRGQEGKEDLFRAREAGRTVNGTLQDANLLTEQQNLQVLFLLRQGTACLQIK
jgi:hypothetical protein